MKDLFEFLDQLSELEIIMFFIIAFVLAVVTEEFIEYQNRK